MFYCILFPNYSDICSTCTEESEGMDYGEFEEEQHVGNVWGTV